jgi:ADP-ribosyl-[dinitrogen reductase] hydrolase
VNSEAALNPGLTSAQTDRAAGVLLGTACGDALGAGYEFGPPLGSNHAVAMVGGGSFGWAPGEWTDDTSMAIAIAEVTADGGSLRDEAALDLIARRWAGWARNAQDVGVQTRSVLASAGSRPSAKMLAKAASAHHARTGRSGGNGSLMRTAPVALAFLHDPVELARAARTVSALTHYDRQAGEACAVWCLAMRYAVLNGNFDGLRLAVLSLPADRAEVWTSRLDEAELHPPEHFDRNGWVVQAMQAAWSAISRTPVPGDDPGGGSFAAQHFQHTLEAAVRGGGDTDTVAAIAGGLLGARWGASAAPLAWRRILHGWPGLGGRDLIPLALGSAQDGRSGPNGWPGMRVVDYSAYGDTGVLAIHPHDRLVLLGGADAARKPPGGVDAVVSLCRLGSAEVPAPGVRPPDHVEVWLVDSADPEHNPNLDLVLVQAADTVAALRAERRTVLIHCVDAVSRTPTVAALYAARHLGIPVQQTLRDVRAVLPAARPNAAFVAALDRLGAPASAP